MNIPSLPSMSSLPTAAAVVSALATVADAAAIKFAGSVNGISNRPDFRDANDDAAIEGSAMQADLEQENTNLAIALGVMSVATAAGAAYFAYKNWESIKSGAVTVVSSLSCNRPSCLRGNAGPEGNANEVPAPAVAPAVAPAIAPAIVPGQLPV